MCVFVFNKLISENSFNFVKFCQLNLNPKQNCKRNLLTVLPALFEITVRRDTHMHTRAQTRTCPAGISTHLCRSLSHFHYHNDSDSDSVCKTAGNFLSVSHRVSFIKWNSHQSAAHGKGVTYTHTRIYTANSVYIDSALMLRNANARVSISNKAEGNTPCIRTIAATAAIKVSSVYCQTICMLQTTRRGRGARRWCMLYEERGGAVGMLM